MAEGRKIEVRIAATGGDQAAAEILKVEQSIGGSGGRSGLVDSHKELASAQNKVSASGASMRGNLQNIGYQFQDIAVQAEMGTSAVRIFSQQVPQMLGGFGPIGAAAGAVIAIGVPLAAALFSAGKAAGESKENVDALKEALDNYADAEKKAVTLQGAGDVTKWFESLDQEEGYWEKINTQIERAIQNQAKLRALQLGAEAARRDMEIARIESDPDLTDAQKTQQIASFRERDAKEKAAEEIAKLKDESSLTGARYTGAAATSERQQADAAEATRKREELEAAQKAEVERAKIATEQVPRIEKGIAAAERSQRFAINPETGETTLAYAEFQRQIDDLKAQLAAAKTASGPQNPEDRAKKLEQDAANLAAAKKAEQDQITAAKKARDEEAKALTEKLQADAALRTQAPVIEDRYRSESEARKIRNEAAIRKQEESDRQKAEAEQARQDAAAKRDATGDDRDAAAAGRKAVSLLPKNVSDKFRDSVEKAAARLQDGDQGGELSRLADLVASLANAKQVKDTALETKLSQLEAQIKNLRTGGK